MGIIYLNAIKMETTNEQVETIEQTNKKPSKYKGLGAAMAAELMIGFWFGIGAILAVKMVNSLEYCSEELIKRK